MLTLKRFIKALGLDNKDLQRGQKQDLVKKSAYQVVKQIDEFKSYIKPYDDVMEFVHDFFYISYKAAIRLAYGLYQLAKVPSDDDPGERALYAVSLILRSGVQLHTIGFRALARGLATLVDYALGEDKITNPIHTASSVMSSLYHSVSDALCSKASVELSQEADLTEKPYKPANPSPQWTVKQSGINADPFGIFNRSDEPGADFSDVEEESPTLQQ